MSKALSFPLSAPPTSIAIMRLSAIGDVMHMLPVVHTLQKVWPQTQITWFIGKLEARLVSDLPGVEFIVFDKSQGLKGYWQLRQQVKHRHWDILLQMQVSLRASLASSLIPATARIGFDRERAADKQWWFTDYQIPHTPRQHVMDGFFEFLTFLGIQEKYLEWPLVISASDTQGAKAKFATSAPILAINPCTSQRRNNWRNWRAERYAAVIEHAVSRGMQVALTGGPDANELAMAQTIIEALPEDVSAQVSNLVGKTNLKGLAALLKEASVVISPDTGPAHIANGVGTPVIGLYVTSNPNRTGPYNRQWVVNQYPRALADIGLDEETAKWGQRVRSPDAMDLITVEQVTAMLDRVISEQAS